MLEYMEIEVVFVAGSSWAWWLVVLEVRDGGQRGLGVAAGGTKQLPWVVERGCCEVEERKGE